MFYRCDILTESGRRYRCTVSTHGWYHVRMWIVGEEIVAGGPVEDIGLRYLGHRPGKADGDECPVDDIAEDITSTEQLKDLFAPVLENLEAAAKQREQAEAAKVVPFTEFLQEIDASIE